MKRTIGFLAATAMALTLAGCEFSIGGISQEDIENSIIEGYEAEGYENVSVTLEETEDGGYTGEVEFTNPNANNERSTLACTVEPAEDNRAPWHCMPSTDDIEESIIANYSGRGATQVSAELTQDGPTTYTGYVDYTDPLNGQKYRHNCTVDMPEGEASWNCAP